MEILFEHTLRQKQEAELAEARAAVERLSQLLRPTTAGGGATACHNSGIVSNNLSSTIGTQQNANTINHNTYNVIAFTESPTRLDAKKLLSALRDCPNFSQYAKMGDDDRFNKDNRSVVHDSIMDLTRLSHEDPLARNVYLSPNRADQVMILAGSDVDTKKWEILPLDDALKHIIGSMSRQLRDVGHDHSIKIDIDDRGALCGLGFITQVEEIRLARELRKPMSAHLENQRYVERGDECDIHRSDADSIDELLAAVQ
jgi:hypothetical protein